MTIEEAKYEVKRNVSIEEVLRLKEIAVNSSGQFSSPFREDKHPSCSWKRDTNTWKDFTTNEGGDVIELYMQLFNLDFMSALKELADKINISLDQLPSNTRPTPEPKAPCVTFGSMMDKALLGDLSEDEAEYYLHRLGSAFQYDDNYEIEIDSQLHIEIKVLKFELKSKLQKERIKKNSKIFTEFYNYCTSTASNADALLYLTETRNLPQETLDHFKVFTVGNYSQVNSHLKKAFTLEDLQRAGLFNENGNLIFYNHRIIISYLWNGQIVYLRGRYFDSKGISFSENIKYIGLRNDSLAVNTPKRLFNVDAIKNMLDGEKLFITEGEFDAMALQTLGYDAIAIPGVGNLPSQEKFSQLLKFRIVLCMDDDKAGKGLKDALIKIFQNNNKEIYIKELPNNAKDVNEFLMVDNGEN